MSMLRTKPPSRRGPLLAAFCKFGELLMTAMKITCKKSQMHAVVTRRIPREG